MRLTRLLAPSLSLALLATAGCDPFQEGKYFREGIGTDLNRPELASSTALLDQYIAYICRQAGLDYSPDGPTVYCNSHGFKPDDWVEFVKAGMNDIDVRCDAYLAWLDNRRRSRGPLLQQVMDMSRAADAILDVTGVGVHQITIVGQAFGLAANTFTNVTSRLLLEVNQSTVQSVVHKSMSDFRNSKKYTDTSTRSEAIHYLRSYLRMCMPFTIETDINTTVSILKRVGPESLMNNALIEPESAMPDLTLAGTSSGPVSAGKAVARKAEEKVVAAKGRPAPKSDDAIKGIFKDYAAEKFPGSIVAKILSVLCVPERDRRNVAIVKEYIAIWEQLTYKKADRDGILDELDRDQLIDKTDCPMGTVKNYFERRRFKDGDDPDASEVVRLLNKVEDASLPDRGRLSASVQLNDDKMRRRIAQVRRALGNDPKYAIRFKTLPNSMGSQLTKDFYDVLVLYPEPNRANGHVRPEAPQPPSTPDAPAQPPAPATPSPAPVQPTLKNGPAAPPK
jgi:hypothetical protein